MEEMDKIKDLEVRVQSLKRSVDLLSVSVLLISLSLLIWKIIQYFWIIFVNVERSTYDLTRIQNWSWIIARSNGERNRCFQVLLFKNRIWISESKFWIFEKVKNEISKSEYWWDVFLKTKRQKRRNL